MSVAYEHVEDFWDYLLCYPEEDEEGFDGIHHGGIRGIRDDAPEAAKQAYEAYEKEQKVSIKEKIKL